MKEIKITRKQESRQARKKEKELEIDKGKRES